jgi:hypothetical protein
MTEPQVLDSLTSFDEDHSDSAAGPKLVIKREQDIPDDHISELKRDKIDTLHRPTGDFYRVASIPVAIVEKWAREGFHLESELSSGTAGLSRVLNRLRSESLDAFITTNKRIT